MDDNEIPTAIKIVNEALTEAGLEASFDYQLKTQLILVIDYTLKAGYIHGWEDCQKKKSPLVTREDLNKTKKVT